MQEEKEDIHGETHHEFDGQPANDANHDGALTEAPATVSSEKKTRRKRRSSSQKQKIIAKGITSKFLFFYPIICLLAIIAYWLKTGFISVLVIIGVLGYMGIQYYFYMYKKRIIITDKKIYIYVKGVKKVSINLEDGFTNIEIRGGKLGSFFNFATLGILLKDNIYVEYAFLNNCWHIYATIIAQHTKILKRKYPDYEMDIVENGIFNKGKSLKYTDKIDSIKIVDE